ncbi:MAG: sugar-binding domain-containing protein [Verrucomicrobiota bacterium]
MKQTVPLNASWKLMHAEPSLGLTAGCSALPLEERWVAAQVPGDVHLDYQRAGLIADPFFGMNHDKLRWMEEMDWWYRTDLTPPAVGPGQRLHLLFEGLDVFATIYLNGKEVGKHANMFTPLRLDVTDQVQPGPNRLEVCLGAPLFPPDRPARQADVRGYGQITRLQVRKSQSCYGWNISPRMVTTGIWKPVSFVLAEAVELDDVWVSTVALAADGTAELEALVELRPNHGQPGAVEVELTVAGQTRTVAIACDPSGGRHVERFTVPQAKLWWPHNHGGQPLYEWSATLRRGGQVLDRRSARFGIRTVQLIQEPDDDGGISFILAINGRKIFLKGMNWTPADAIFARVDDARYDQLLAAAKGANINAMRVWGGGIYEHDSFYAKCDELGLVITHDFMFACGCYPQDLAFLDAARREAEFQVRRLRHYACVAAWFGDNENDVLADNSFHYPAYRHNRLSKEVLKAVVQTHAPRTPYVPTSPYSPLTYDQNAPTEGDCHIWGHGLSYKSDFYVKQRPRMVTEIGHLSLPSEEVIRSFVSPQNLWPVYHEEYLTHGADCIRLDRVARYRLNFDNIRERGWPEPQTLGELIRLTQQLQGEASRFWIEFYGNQPNCWGIFLWNLADSWPQMSDAYIAYPYAVKRSLQDVQEAYAALAR